MSRASPERLVYQPEHDRDAARVIIQAKTKIKNMLFFFFRLNLTKGIWHVPVEDGGFISMDHPGTFRRVAEHFGYTVPSPKLRFPRIAGILGRDSNPPSRDPQAGSFPMIHASGP